MKNYLKSNTNYFVYASNRELTQNFLKVDSNSFDTNMHKTAQCTKLVNAEIRKPNLTYYKSP